MEIKRIVKLEAGEQVIIQTDIGSLRITLSPGSGDQLAVHISPREGHRVQPSDGPDWQGVHHCLVTPDIDDLIEQYIGEFREKGGGHETI